MKELRYYQEQCVNAIWNNLDKHPLVSVPTGGGKSLIIAELCKRALTQYPGTRICILTPKKELIEQNYSELLEQYPEAPAGIFCAGLNQKNAKDITVATIQSIYKHCFEDPYELIIVDECHLINKSGEGMFHAFFAVNPDAKIIGLTATPYRLTSGYLHKGQGALFDDLVYDCNIRQLINEKYLSNIISFRGSKNADVEHLHIKCGEFRQDELVKSFMNKDITVAAIEDAIAKCSDRKSILVFTCSVEHAHYVAHIFSNYTDSIDVVTGETDSKKRSDLVSDFRSGRLKYLVNCDVYTTGFNAPNVDCIILLRATKSPGLYVQMVGRGLRISGGKSNCLLLDYGENVKRHGTIDDVFIMPTGKDKKKRTTWECPECKAFNSYKNFMCLNCGYERNKVERDMLSGLVSVSSASEIIGKDIEEFNISHIRLSKHISNKGTECVRADYLEELYGYPIVSEYIGFGVGFFADKGLRWMIRHGCIAKSIDELLKCEIIYPKKILVDKTEKFKKIIKEIF
jgi:DNA repair protein RadD